MSQRNKDIRSMSNAELTRATRQAKKPAKPREDRTRNAYARLHVGEHRFGFITVGMVQINYHASSWSQCRNARKFVRKVLPELLAHEQARPHNTSHDYNERIGAWRNKRRELIEKASALYRRVPIEIVEFTEMWEPNIDADLRNTENHND